MKNAGTVHLRFVNALAEMQSMAIVETENWKTESLLDPSVLKQDTAARYTFATGFAAAKRGDIDRAESALKAMRESLARFKNGKDVDPEETRALEVGASELSGFIQAKNGHAAAGLRSYRLRCCPMKGWRLPSAHQ